MDRIYGDPITLLHSFQLKHNMSLTPCSPQLPLVLQELHVDLIRFSVPVVIREVRVVAREQRIPIKIEQIDFDRFGSVVVSVFHHNLYMNPL